MPYSRLRALIPHVTLLAGLTLVSGCASMGGNMANSSGMGYYEKGNYAAAASEFQTAMMNDPSNPDYMANFAKSRLKMGDVAGAEQYFRQALTVSPSHQPSYHGLAELMVAQNRGQEAQAMLQTWAATQPYVAESHVELAWLQREMGNSQGAVQSLQQALQVNPSHSAALAQMGQYYEEIGRPDQAVAMYQNSLRSDWNQPEVHSRIAAVAQQAGASSPMAATAMARGVHPYDVPRQETAFGPPSPGAQMAQQRMMNSQMAMSGYGMPGNPMMGQAMPGQMMAAGFGPGSVSATPGGSGSMMSAYYSPSMSQSMMPMNGASGWHQSGTPMPMMPAQTASAAMMMGPGESFSFPNPSPGTSVPFEIPSKPATETAVSPTPDPAFSSKPASVPAQTVSLSTSVPETTAIVTSTSGSEPPLVDAF